jgi:hypothetical protein
MHALLRCLLVGFLLGCFCLCGCGKKEKPPSPESQVISTPSGSINLADVDKAIEQKDYDAAIKLLSEAKAQDASLTEEQRVQLDQKVQTTVNALVEVMAEDPKAKAAYSQLGKLMTGR